MLFNSLEFLIFFPVVTVAYFLLPYRYRTVLLLLASCFFYAAFVPAYLLILLFLISVDFWAGGALERAEGKRRFQILLASVLANASMLIFFKYFNFLNDNLNILARFLDLHLTIPHLDILLPVGLSFHVFQSVSYTIEVYRKRAPAEKSFLTFALYVMFYPQLVAGPIERPQRLLPQLHKNYDFDYARVTSGVQLMAWGIFKKVVIADQLGLVVDSVYADPAHAPGTALVLATVFFAYQLYCDFSGYTDIARGAARVMGIELMRNFNFPYNATTVTEFWRRWHISLSSWIRDYIFMPVTVALRRRGALGIVGGFLVAFFFVGLWHGASWMFVVFGLLHGVLLSLEYLTAGGRRRIVVHVPAWVATCCGRIYVFLAWSLSLIFFRSGSFSDALVFFRHLFSAKTVADCTIFFAHIFNRSYQEIYLPRGGHRKEYLIIMIGLALLLVVEGLSRKWPLRERFNNLPAPMRFVGYSLCCWSIAAGGIFIHRQFIYFTF